MPMEAHWIWTSEALPPRNQFVFFRKRFSHTDSPDEARLLITAERFFQIWVNGEWVGQGPALGHPAEKAYDIYDIRSLLKVGENVIAIVVQFDGDATADGARWFVPETVGGLWCQVEGRAGGAPFLVTSDGTWASHPAEGWDPEAPFLNDLYFQEHFTFGMDPSGWHTEDFDDGAWPRSVVLGDADGTDVDGKDLPWRQLVPRDIPLLTHQKHLPVSISPGEIVERLTAHDIGIRMSLEPVVEMTKASVQGEGHLVSPGEGACVMQNSDPFEPLETFNGVHDAVLILDFAHLRNAHLILEVDGPAGAILDIGYGPNLIEGRVYPYRSSRTSWADRVVLAEGKQRWRSFFFRQFRFVQITLRKAEGPVRLHQVEAESVTHTWENTTTFRCPDPQLEAFWKAGIRTAETCTMDIFVDNFSRECRHYHNDPMASGTAALHGNAPILRRYLRHLTHAQLPNGRFMCCCPGKGNIYQTHCDASLYFVLSFWNQYRRFGDRTLLEDHWDAIGRHLKFWGGLTNARGLLTVEETCRAIVPRVWLDWAELDRRGEMLALNGLYLHNLRAGKQAARILGKEGEASEYEAREERIAQVLRTEFWDEDRGLFVDAVVDGEKGGNYSEGSQGVVLYLGLASPEQVPRLLRTWRRFPPYLAKTDMKLGYYVLEGLAECGDVALAVRLFRRLQRFLDIGNETFGENLGIDARTVGLGFNGRKPGLGWHHSGSRAVSQGHAGWPTAFLLERVAGLQPRWGEVGGIRLAPGLAVDSVEVNWCGHELRWEQDAVHFDLEARFTGAAPVEFVLPFAPEEVRSLSVNGTERTAAPVFRLEACTDLDVRVVLA